MYGTIRQWVYNPSSLKLLSVCCIRHSISCLGKNVERNLIEKLTAGDFDDLKNPNVPISLEDMCLGERKLVLESCLRRGSWGLLEMFILLTDDIVEFDVVEPRIWDLDAVLEQLSPTIDIKLDYIKHQDLLLSLLVARSPNLERLSLEYCQDRSQKELEKLCKTMSHITKLNLSQRAASHRYDGVLRAIAANMRHLKYLDISSITVEPKFIEYLLPTEDNAMGGCKELAYLNLCQIREVEVMLLKKIILALPKLNCLRHELVVNALGDLTEEEMGADTGRSLNSLCASLVYTRSGTRYCRNRLQVLAKSPIFKRFNNIAALDIELRQQESGSLSDVLRSLQLRRVTLRGVPTGHKLPHLLSLSLLQSISAGVQHLTFTDLSGDMSLIDIMRSFKHLVKLKLINIHKTFENDSTKNCSSTRHEPVETLSKLHMLNFLDEILLHCLDENVCSADMLVALLQSPNIKIINVLSVEAMTDDVMFIALSSPGGAALSTVTQLFVMECPLITAAPFVHWLTRENCSLQYIHICGCKKIDCNFLRDVAEQYPRALIVSERLDI